jgi:hypothetical protein
MRVSINGRPARELDQGLARQIAVRGGPDACEGVTLTAEAAVAGARRALRIVHGVLGALAVVVTLAALGAAAAYEPRDLLLALPLAAASAGCLWLLIRFAWRRNLARAGARADAQGALTAPGVEVKVEAAGITVGGAHWPWSGVRVDEVGVIARTSDDTTTYEVDRLTLRAGGRALILDAQALSNGPLIVKQAWRRIGAAPSG